MYGGVINNYSRSPFLGDLFEAAGKIGGSLIGGLIGPDGLIGAGKRREHEQDLASKQLAAQKAQADAMARTAEAQAKAAELTTMGKIKAAAANNKTLLIVGGVLVALLIGFFVWKSMSKGRISSSVAPAIPM